jgi:hypothetical protein
VSVERQNSVPIFEPALFDAALADACLAFALRGLASRVGLRMVTVPGPALVAQQGGAS